MPESSLVNKHLRRIEMEIMVPMKDFSSSVIRKFFFHLFIIFLLGLYATLSCSIEASFLLSSSNDEMQPFLIEKTDGSEIFLVYSFNANGNFDIFSVKLDSEGNLISTPVQLTTNSSDDENPRGCFCLNKYFVVFESYRTDVRKIFLTFSEDGKSWSEIKNLTRLESNEEERNPSIVEHNNLLYVFWVKTSYSPGSPQGFVTKLVFKTSSDGESWSSEKETNLEVGDGGFLKVKKLGEKFFATWCNGSKLYYSTSTDGISWSTPQVLASNVEFPTSVEADGKIYVVYNNESDNELWYMSYDTFWEKAKKVTSSPSSDTQPEVIFASNGKFMLVWSSNRRGNYDILFMSDETFPEETQPTQQPSCGNGICELGEDCYSCPSDCPCPQPSQDLCANVTCEDKCVGTTLYTNGRCNPSTGECEYDIIENSTKCGYKPPEVKKDATPPLVRIISPVEGKVYQSREVWLNFSADEEVKWCKYSVNQGLNVTLNANSSKIKVPAGKVSLTVYCSDLSGNVGKSVVRFEVREVEKVKPKLMETVIEAEYSPKEVKVGEKVKVFATLSLQNRTKLAGKEIELWVCFGGVKESLVGKCITKKDGSCYFEVEIKKDYKRCITNDTLPLFVFFKGEERFLPAKRLLGVKVSFSILETPTLRKIFLPLAIGIAAGFLVFILLYLKREGVKYREAPY